LGRADRKVIERGGEEERRGGHSIFVHGNTFKLRREVGNPE
jgi:hypothetical protein